jgi:hypothetical protein
MPRQTTRVRLELLVLVAIPAIIPLSWDFTVRWFASFGGADRRLPEQGRNRRSGLVSELLAHLGMTRTEPRLDGGLTICGGIRGYGAVSSQTAYDISHVPLAGLPVSPPHTGRPGTGTPPSSTLGGASLSPGQRVRLPTPVCPIRLWLATD